MERITSVKRQLGRLTRYELFDLVKMIRYELGARADATPPKLKRKYSQLALMVEDWEED